MKETIFFFYGTLKQGFYNDYLTKNMEYLGEFTTIPRYTLYDGGFPVVERGGETAIKGELYLCSNTAEAQEIFELEGCTGEQGNPRNWYDFDMLDTIHGKAVMFVMDKGKCMRTQIIKEGVWK